MIPITAFSPEHIRPHPKAGARPRPEIESGGNSLKAVQVENKKEKGIAAN